MEIWKDIPNYEGKYQVSNLGNVKSFTRWGKGKILKCSTNGNPGPYKHVNLVGAGRNDVKSFYVHRLVAEAFVDNPNGYTEINHIDGDTLNNSPDNLEWCKHIDNMHHAFENGLISHEFERGKLHPNSKAVIQMEKDGTVVKEWESVNQIQRETDYRASSIFCCCNHRKYCKTAYGYRWEYKNG